MANEPEKPIRYGIFPVGLGYLSFFVMFGVMALFSWFFDVVRWILRWLE